ncbi:MAG: helix-turn-helix domain-containing protein [Desulfomonilaceae bacterium]
MEERELVQTKGAAEIAPLLDAEDVARILKSSVKTVHKRVREGKLACVQSSLKDRKFTREQVQAYIEAQSTGVRVDRSKVKPVKSRPPKGGEKSFGVSKADLRKEMRQWA